MEDLFSKYDDPDKDSPIVSNHLESSVTAHVILKEGVPVETKGFRYYRPPDYQPFHIGGIVTGKIVKDEKIHITAVCKNIGKDVIRKVINTLRGIKK